MSGRRSHSEGLLFDTAYLEPEAHLWIRADDGEMLCLSVPFYPVFYLAGSRAVVEAATAKAAASGVVEPLGWRFRLEFWSGRSIPVMALRALQPGRVVGLARALLHADQRLTVYDADLDPALLFHIQHGLFPLARVALSHQDGRLLSIRALDDPADPSFEMPPLRVLTLRLTGPALVPPEEGNGVRAEMAGERVELSREDPAGGLHALNEMTARLDPDVILSLRGDQVIFPWLLTIARACGVPLLLDRAAPRVQRQVVREGAVRQGAVKPGAARKGQSIVVYGQVLFKAAAYPLLGRWHLDEENSFFIDKAGLEGLVELARLSRLPVQRQARTSGGTAMTAMEIDLALRQGILVPFIKDQVEAFRPAADLLREDKGGLTTFPPVGVWEGVIELDFQQQYPTIMAVHNVSPETVDCQCCPGVNPVPGVNHHTCARRRGLVPQALRMLLDKRLKYKRLLKASSGADLLRYDARQSAIKWTLVTTFGYQGFKSAKFGHIAAHESITAWGRETLLVAKEVYEAADFILLHALTDSLYLTRPGFTAAAGMAEVERLAGEVKRRTGLTLAVEGVYDWLCFLPSNMREGLSVATRYFGRFSGAPLGLPGLPLPGLRLPRLPLPRLKVRGLKVRQHGTPPFLRAFQHACLHLMGECVSRAQLEAAVPRLLERYRRARAELWSGKVALEELVITARVGRELESYRASSAVHLSLRFLARHGIRIPPGQKVQYVILHRKARDPASRYLPVPFLHQARDYDASAYQHLLRETFREVTINLPAATRATNPPQNLSLW